jgi:hypothetical protein
MPSLHIAWAMWCAVAIFLCARRLWVRLLGLAYPVGTLLVIVGTANHFIIDAVFGALALAGGVVIQRLMSGRGAFTPPGDAPGTGTSEPPVPSHRADR